MRITVFFHFDHDPEPAAETGVEGDVSDMLLPIVGDVVTHADFKGNRTLGRVRQRVFNYDLPSGLNVEGVVSVTILLEPLPVH